MIPEVFVFNLISIEFTEDWDEQVLIDGLMIINPNVAVTIAMNFFGVSSFNIVQMTLQEEERVKRLFDEYLISYKYTIAGRIVEKIYNEDIFI